VTAGRARAGSVPAVLAVALLFSNLVLFLFLRERLPVPPLVFALGTIAVALPWAPDLLAAVLRGRPHPVVAWAGFALVLALAGFVIHPGPDAPDQLLRRGVALTFLVAMIALAGPAGGARAARVALVLAVLAGVVLNLLEVVTPLRLSAVLGRAAGLYLNPNISGGALAAGAVVALVRVPSRWRVPFLAAVTLGILATLSRGALAAWTVGVAALVVTGGLATRHALVAAAVAGAVAAGAALAVQRAESPALLDALAPAASRWDRLEPATLADHPAAADQLRTEAAAAAWALFREQPLAGAGAGATERWGLPESTHNSYLRGAAEHGVAGLLLLPLLLVALARVHPAGPGRTGAIACAAVLGAWGLFSHNLLEEWPFLVALAVAAGDDGA
jgi:O-antigen ligase